MAPPKGPQSLSVRESFALAEDVEAVMGGCGEAGPHSGGRDARAMG